jgi:hypothetical protein
MPATGEEIVGVGTALGPVRRRNGGEEDVVIDEEGAVVDLDEEVLARELWWTEVAGHARALRHPVQPDAAVGVVDVVAGDEWCRWRVELDARHLGAVEELADVDVVDVVAGDGAEGAPRLPTMPACSQCEMWLFRTMWWPMFSFDHPGGEAAFDGFDVAFGGVGGGVVERVAVLAEGDAGARE